MDLGADAVADRADRRVAVAQQRRRAGRRDLGFVGDHQRQRAQRLLDPARPAVVHIREVGHLTDKVEVDLGDQVVLRREVRVRRRRGDLRAGGHRPHRQVGVRGLTQHLDTGGEHLAEGLLLPTVAWRLGDRNHWIAGHMSKLSDEVGFGQVPTRNTQYKRPNGA